MTEIDITLSECASDLDKREREILLCQKSAAQYLKSKHTSKQSRQQLEELRDRRVDLINISLRLLELKSNRSFSEAAKTFSARCNELKVLLKDTETELKEDMALLVDAEGKNKFDVIKGVSFFFAIPGIMIASVKNGAGSHYVSPDQAAVAGFALTSSILLRKHLLGAFQSVGKALCSTGRDIRHSFVLYYLKESTMTKARVAANGMKAVPHVVTVQLDRVARQIGFALTSNSVLLVSRDQVGDLCCGHREQARRLSYANQSVIKRNEL